MQNKNHREELREIYQREEDLGEVVYIPAKDKKNIFSENQRLRVCAYCRVSTDSDEQLSSYELQQQHYKDLADHHPNWNLTHIFADEGISGTSTKKRKQFNEMIARCFAGEFDLIVTKSVSRFARNIVDCMSLVRKLKNHRPPIGIYFETDNINTLAEESELKLSVISTFAQAESEKKSESMIWSLKERFKRKKLLTPAPFGYDRPRDAVGNYIKYAKLEINEAEARVVRFIFDAFLAGVPISNICQILMENEIPTKSGNMVWHDGTVQYILGNERYCGNVLTWKTFTSDIFEHTKSVNVNDRDQHLYKNTHDAIISVEKYEAALQLLAQRKLGMRAGLHIMQVVDVGIFQGYVPINHRWIGNDPNAYFEASDSARRNQQAQKIRRSAFSAFDLTGYQVVRGQFMNSRTELPCMSITKDKITFNSTCTRRLTDTTHVQLLLHPTERKLAIRPCSEDDTFSISWLSRSNLPLAIKNVSSPHFCSALFQIMDWNPEFTYRILGTAIEKGNDQIIIFNLPTAMPILVYKEEVEGTNEYKRKRIQMCPDEWGDSFGEEFYDFSLDNSLYYSPVNTQWRAGEKCRAVNAPEGFTIPTVKEVLRDADQLRLHWEETHE